MTKNEIQHVRSLAQKRDRLQEGLFVVEGAKLVGEMLTAPEMEVVRVYCREGAELRLSSEEQRLIPTLEYASRADMERCSQLKTPSEILATVRIPSWEFAPTADALYLALDQVQDPGNLGTILRIADWFGIRDVICSPTTADCFNPKVVQATMGAIARVRVHYRELPTWLDQMQQEGVPIYGTLLDGDSIYESSLTRGGVVVMGHEGRGLSTEVIERITHRLYIPPFPAGEITSESLNVGVATGIVCAEFRRRG